jgi:putative ABC transport system permease protein
MLLNYLKLSLRLMARNPFFTAINIFGLGIGFATFFALWDYSVNELKADQFHKDADRIARIGWYWRYTDDGKNWDQVTVGFSKSDLPVRAAEDFDEVEDFTRIHTQPFFGVMSGLVPHERKINMATVGRKEERIFKEDHIVYADKNLFTFFSIPLIHGKADEVLADAGSIVLSESQARKYFDKDNPTGELLKLNDTITLKVTGVFQDLPHNTHLTFNMVISNQAYLRKWASVINGAVFNYLKLKEGISYKEFEGKLNGRKKDYFAALLNLIANTEVDIFLQPLPEIIFSPNYPGDEFSFRSYSLLITFAIVSVVILGMAWINYVNLWIARNKKREKELATRKINGARGKDFVMQFLTESVLINFLATILALTLLQFVRVPLSTLFNIPVKELWQADGWSLLVFVVAILFSIGLTGLYPAWIARSNNPLSLFRTSHKPSGSLFSSSLIILQYTSAITLIVWSSVVYLELNHVLNKEIGLDRENVMIVEIPSTKEGQYKLDELVNRLSGNASIHQTAYSILAPGELNGPGFNTRILGSETQIGFEWNGVNENYLPLYGLKMLAGRNFVTNDRSDVAIITDVAAARYGFTNPEDVVGIKLEALTNEQAGSWIPLEVIGVVEDFHSIPFFDISTVTTDQSNEYQSRGKMFTYKNTNVEFFPLEKLSVKLNPGSLRETVAAVEAAYKISYPGTAFTWFFLEDNLNKAYFNEKITRNRIVLFVVLAMIIACLGFQGMITHKVTSQIKEIGIRKILGAGTGHIGKVILQPSSIQFGISIMIGVPVAWYLGELYLQKFSERIVLQWWHYAIPVLILLFIMFCTVAALVWKAAKSNPVEALKYE